MNNNTTQHHVLYINIIYNILIHERNTCLLIIKNIK